MGAIAEACGSYNALGRTVKQSMQDIRSNFNYSKEMVNTNPVHKYGIYRSYDSKHSVTRPSTKTSTKTFLK